MKKIDPTVIKETVYIAVCTVILSVIMQVVFVIIGQWDITVLLGNLLSAFFAVLNFFLMGFTVQKAVNLEQKEAASKIRLSQTLRTLMLFAAAAAGALIPCFNIWASLIPLLFPRIAITFRPLLNKKDK